MLDTSPIGDKLSRMEQNITPNNLLAEITSFLASTGMGESYFGKVSCGSSELVKRLRRGGRVWPETEIAIRAFMRSYDRTKTKAGAS